jgi:hypothetical protein
MENHVFPTDTCVLACSGPSLNSVDVYSLGLPVVAISTAIRTIPKPNYWILADYLNEMHGDNGKLAYSNEEIVKVIPDNKISGDADPKSLVLCKYDTSTRWPDLDKHLFSGNEPFVRGPHKSVTFGIQWLHHVGVKKIIWAGNDLTATSMKGKYSYEVQDFDMKKEYNYMKTLDQTADALKKWYPIALERGFEWYSWRCGSVFESFVPQFQEDWWENEGKNEITTPTLEIKVNKIIEQSKKSTKISRNVVAPPKIIKHTPKNVQKNIIEPPEQVFLPQKTYEETVLNKMESPKEIMSDVREHRRMQIDIRKNLRAK